MEGQKKQRIQEGEAEEKEEITITKHQSPIHEFSFAVSLESSSTRNPESHQPPLAIDLTPADDIFFHGHLLPLHLLSNLPVSPRSSTNSLDDFTLPVTELTNNRMDGCIGSECDNSARGQSFNSYDTRRRHNHMITNGEFSSKERAKSKSFSLLRLGRRRKEAEGGEGEAEDQGEKHKKKLRFDVAHFLKRYIRMFSKERRQDIQFRKQPYSFSGKLSSREARDLRGRRGEMSAPASIRTSPGNSGVLMAPFHHSKDSSMEELQAAIQAAIAHCKNSISAADKHDS